MIIKFIVTCIIAITMISYINTTNSHSLKESVTDREMEITAAMLDKEIVSYYCNHGGTLPDKLDTFTLRTMGFNNVFNKALIELDKYEYKKISDNSFRLNVKLSKSIISTVHSDMKLIRPPEVH